MSVSAVVPMATTQTLAASELSLVGASVYVYARRNTEQTVTKLMHVCFLLDRINNKYIK